MRKAAYAVVLSALMLVSFFAGRHFTHKDATGGASARRVLYWVDPMHPSYKSDKPGIAPDCGMDLEPVYADSGAKPMSASLTSGSMPAGTVRIDPEKQQVIGLQTVEVEKSSGSRSMRILGRVTADDTRVFRINAGVAGWLRETFDSSIGSQVKKDQRLATFYSPEFLTLEQGYLVATERLTSTGKQPAAGTQTTAVRLRNLGMSDVQIEKLGETKQLPENVEIVAPADGFIIARNVSPGQRFDVGAEFYRIADLSHVWVVADVFESDAQQFRPGTVATITLPHAGRTLSARVSDVLPQYDPATRTMKLRLEADNPGFDLRPDMFVDVGLPVAIPAGMSVPADAVIDSGERKRVFVDRGNGYFEPREVEISWRFNDRVGIVKGLHPGERVVSAGTFLVDSESRLKTVSSLTPDSSAQSAPMESAPEDNPMPGKHPMKRDRVPAEPVKEPVCDNCKQDTVKLQDSDMASTHRAAGHD
jgi:RND family efflux transporter MFP subunit